MCFNFFHFSKFPHSPKILRKLLTLYFVGWLGKLEVYIYRRPGYLEKRRAIESKKIATARLQKKKLKQNKETLEKNRAKVSQYIAKLLLKKKKYFKTTVHSKCRTESC